MAASPISAQRESERLGLEVIGIYVLFAARLSIRAGRDSKYVDHAQPALFRAPSQAHVEDSDDIYQQRLVIGARIAMLGGERIEMRRRHSDQYRLEAPRRRCDRDVGGIAARFVGNELLEVSAGFAVLTQNAFIEPAVDFPEAADDRRILRQRVEDGAQAPLVEIR